MNGAVYLDHNATTPAAPEVVSERVDALQHVWGNRSSTHGPGQAARRTLADARARVARLLGCQGAEGVFTSGATEANHMAVLDALQHALPRMAALRPRLEQGLLQGLPGTHLHGAHAPRLPDTTCLRFGELHAESVLEKLERAGVVASSGAACTADGTQPSHVLPAMGQTPAQAKCGVRSSLGRSTTADDIEPVLSAAVRVMAPLLAEAVATVG